MSRSDTLHLYLSYRRKCEGSRCILALSASHSRDLFQTQTLCALTRLWKTCYVRRSHPIRTVKCCFAHAKRNVFLIRTLQLCILRNVQSWMKCSPSALETRLAAKYSESDAQGALLMEKGDAFPTYRNRYLSVGLCLPVGTRLLVRPFCMNQA